MDYLKKTLIDHSKWEKRQKQAFQERHEPFQEAVTDGDEKGYDFNSFSQDLFSSLYQVAPEFPEEVSSGHKWQKDALDTMKDLREYKDIRNSGTVCDPFQSGLGATVMAQHFAEDLPAMEKTNPDDLRNQIEAYKQLMESFPKQAKEKGMKAKVKELKKQIPEAEQAWGGVHPDPQALRISMRKALVAAQEAVNEASSMAAAFGYGTSPGQDGYSDPAQKLKIAELVRNNPKLKKLAEIAGRFRREARAVQGQKKSPGPDELTNVETGSDFGRLLPSEMVKLSHKLLKLEFYKNMLDRSLMQYKLETVEKKQRGPIIVCLDNSASMDGLPELWSKGIAMALCQIAIDQNRTFEILHFDTEVKRKDIFPAGKVDVALLIESMSYFTSGGGTKFAPPLGRAFREIVNAKEQDLGDADVIFITDGYAPLSTEEQNRIKIAKELTEASLYTVCLGQSAESLEPISDKMYTLSDLTEEDGEMDALKQTLFSI